MPILSLSAAPLAATAALILATPYPVVQSDGPIAAQVDGFTRVSDAGESRIDGVRDGTHEGVPVRFLDMTIRNTSGETTFPETIQKVWWQGRTSGRSEDARHRNLRQRGMYEYVKPGAVWTVTYIIPRRDDVLGVTIIDPAQRSTAKARMITWEELRGDTPTTGTPTGEGFAGADPAAAVEQGKAAVEKLPEPVRRKIAPTVERLKEKLGARLPRLFR